MIRKQKLFKISKEKNCSNQCTIWNAIVNFMKRINFQVLPQAAVNVTSSYLSVHYRNNRLHTNIALLWVSEEIFFGSFCLLPWWSFSSLGRLKTALNNSFSTLKLKSERFQKKCFLNQLWKKIHLKNAF